LKGSDGCHDLTPTKLLDTHFDDNNFMRQVFGRRKIAVDLKVNPPDNPFWSNIDDAEMETNNVSVDSNELCYDENDNLFPFAVSLTEERIELHFGKHG